jgi:phosphopantetheinyl transferase (holo-ACP synthase)
MEDLLIGVLQNRRQVTTSSTEAEFLSVSFAAKEAIWWKNLFKSIQFDPEHELNINCDNLQTIRILKKETPKLDTKLRHVDIHQHWLRQEVLANRITLSWIPTAEMPADGLTKNLPRQKHERFIKQLNLVDIGDQLDHYRDGSTDDKKNPTEQIQSID